MSWNEINLSNINPNLEIVPAKAYTFELCPGARYGTNDPGRIECSAAVADDSDFTGRRIFFSYPDPAKQDWSPRTLKRLSNALGIDPDEHEDPVLYLNRVSGTRFMAEVKHRPANEEYPAKAELNIFTVRPAA